MPVKTVKVSGVQGAKFRMELTAGGHKVTVDQPVPMGGDDEGPNPLEYTLFALAGCIGAIGRIIANQRKLQVRGFSVEVEGKINTDNLLGQDSGERAGFQDIAVRVNIDSDMTDDEKSALLHDIDSRCPVSDNLQNPVPVSFELM